MQEPDAPMAIASLCDDALAVVPGYGPGDDDDDDDDAGIGGGGGGGGNIDPDEDEGYDGDEDDDDDDEEPLQVSRVESACCMAAKCVKLRRLRCPAVLTVARRKLEVPGNRIIGF